MSALSRPGSYLTRCPKVVLCAAALAAALLVCGCMTRQGEGENAVTNGAEEVERLRLAVMDARSTAEEAGAERYFPELLSSVQARFNASMDAEGLGESEAAAEGYRRCRTLYGTLARLADARSLRDELAADVGLRLDEAAWEAAERSLAAAVKAFLVDDRGAARSADEALALYSGLGGLNP